jgi:hypothetical protein
MIHIQLVTNLSKFIFKYYVKNVLSSTLDRKSGGWRGKIRGNGTTRFPSDMRRLDLILQDKTTKLKQVT